MLTHGHPRSLFVAGGVIELRITSPPPLPSPPMYAQRRNAAGVARVTKNQQRTRTAAVHPASFALLL